MDLERKNKRQNLKVIISEAIMVLAVIATVTVLAFVVSGYWINSDFEVERQGMLQISSVPTGATINIDGETSSWLQRTNTSKVLPNGEHTVTLTKEGYDSWTKTINIKEGLLYRLHYPRLFLEDRTPEDVFKLKDVTLATMSSDHDYLLLINGTTKWSYLDLNSSKLEPVSIDISKLFSSVSLAEDATTGLFTGEILKADWDFDDAHVLFKVKNSDTIEWVLLDIKSPDKSVNLTKEFGVDFSSIKILNNSSSTLLAVQDGNLRKIDVSGRQISASLVEDVVDYDHYNNEIVFVAQKDEGYYTGFFKVGDSDITELGNLDSAAKITISKFYDDKYITILQDSKVSAFKKDDPENITYYDLTFAPAKMKVGHDGEFITMYTGSKIATLDMEAGLVREWSPESDNFGWLDNDMIYAVKDGELIVYDYDGLNRRVLAKNVSAHFPVGITDNKWLYYDSDGSLMRETIRD